MDNYVVTDLVGEGSFGKVRKEGEGAKDARPPIPRASTRHDARSSPSHPPSSQVYKARRRHTGTLVAIKFISKAGKSERDVRGLRAEIDILRSVRHPHVVAMLDAFETATDFAVVTEYAHGELFEVLEDDGCLGEDAVRHVAGQLVAALHHLHGRRIIHRDMKPQNVLVAGGGVLKLCDFGFARSLSAATAVVTSVKGTPLYMAPELVRERPYDHRADLWSLGVILYELFAGRPPFYTSSIVALVRAVVADPVVLPRGASPKFASLLSGLLTKDPASRLDWPDLLHHPFLAGAVPRGAPQSARARAAARASAGAAWRGSGVVGRMVATPCLAPCPPSPAAGRRWTGRCLVAAACAALVAPRPPPPAGGRPRRPPRQPRPR